MNSSINLHRDPLGTAKFGLTIGAFLLASSLTLAEPSPSKPPKPASTPKAASKPRTTPTPKATPTPSKPPQSSPTPETKIDAKTEAELLQAEDRFIIAILNGDAKALAELLHDGYADSLGEHASVATSKRGVLSHVGGDMPAYRILKDRKLSVSGDLFTVEGLAHAERQTPGDKPWDEWFRVRRLWTKTEGRWVITAQMITPLDNDEKAKEKD